MCQSVPKHVSRLLLDPRPPRLPAAPQGFTTEVRLYTQAMSACMLRFPGAWERALEIYSALQRASVRPDKKFFACLIAVAGRCGRLDTAFELLTDMAAEGIRPSGTTVSAVVHACLTAGNLALARRVYDLCARQGVYPVPSQFNRMMDVYASEKRWAGQERGQPHDIRKIVSLGNN